MHTLTVVGATVASLLAIVAVCCGTFWAVARYQIRFMTVMGAIFGAMTIDMTYGTNSHDDTDIVLITLMWLCYAGLIIFSWGLGLFKRNSGVF